MTTTLLVPSLSGQRYLVVSSASFDTSGASAIGTIRVGDGANQEDVEFRRTAPIRLQDNGSQLEIVGGTLKFEHPAGAPVVLL